MKLTFPNRKVIPTRPAIFGPCSLKAERRLLRACDAAVWLGTLGIVASIFFLSGHAHHAGPVAKYHEHVTSR